MRNRFPDLWSVEEWLRDFGPHYGITTAEYIRRCCRGDLMATGHICHLPHGWRADKYGRSWLLCWTDRGAPPVT